MPSHFAHLVIPSHEAVPYRGRGSGRTNLPDRNARVHGSYLHQRLETAWNLTTRRYAAIHVNRRGVYLEVRGEAGFELVTKSLESFQGNNPESWQRLLNVRREISEDDQGSVTTTCATVFVPENRKHQFLKKITDYEQELRIAGGNIKNQTLISSISDIREALVESFWVDDSAPIPEDTAEWCEVWLSSDKDEALEQFRELLQNYGIGTRDGVIRFPERLVLLVYCNRAQLDLLVAVSDDIAELRLAKQTANYWIEAQNYDQVEWVRSLLDRVDIAASRNTAICILDTGVNTGHPLLQSHFEDGDTHSVEPDWNNDDRVGHGTWMAGVALYFDLQRALEGEGPVSVRHRLESVKILPPTGANNPRLWGDIVSQGVSLAEIHAADRRRVYCMAVTSEDTRDSGQPSSWSGIIDSLCASVGRVFIVSAGNTTVELWKEYPEGQKSSSVHDPAQAWNAITVGAYTDLVDLIDPMLDGFQTIALSGGLSPYSTTSFIWDDKWPIKPEILMEGGNVAIDQNGFITECNDLSLISTHHQPAQGHFVEFRMTSASAAQASWFAAQLHAQYPDYWSETIRGLMIHSSRWTDQLKEQFLGRGDRKEDYRRLLRIAGYGVPSLERALFSAENSLTLISEAEIQPFHRESDRGQFKINEMHLYELPWPVEVLRSLPDDVDVTMKITLSYFIEPSPGRIGWKDRYRYASHGLRFDVNSPTETRDEFLRRINEAARDEENGHPGTSSASEHWTYGIARNKGSIHSDVWTGTAADLAESNLIAVYPIGGWWKDRYHLNRGNGQVRYSLIVSIDSSEESVDVYTPVAVQIGIPIET